MCIEVVCRNIDNCPPIGHLLPVEVVQRIISTLSRTKILNDKSLPPLLSQNISSLSICDRVGNRITDETLKAIYSSGCPLIHLEMQSYVSINCIHVADVLKMWRNHI